MKDQKYETLKIENQICFPLYACSREIIKQYKPYLDELDLTYTQYITMLVLWEQKNVTVKSLGQALYLDSGTLTPLLKKMASKGLINRKRSEIDERNLIVTLTEKGEALREKALGIPEKIASCLTLTREEQVTLYRILYQVLNAGKEEKES